MMMVHLKNLSAALAGLMILALPLLGAPAEAQGSNCADRAYVLERLAMAYGETRQAIGLAPNNVIVEVFASLESGTWTITVTSPGGITCLVASGQAYEATGGDLEPTRGSAL